MSVAIAINCAEIALIRMYHRCPDSFPHGLYNEVDGEPTGYTVEAENELRELHLAMKDAFEEF